MWLADIITVLEFAGGHNLTIHVQFQLKHRTVDGTERHHEGGIPRSIRVQPHEVAAVDPVVADDGASDHDLPIGHQLHVVDGAVEAERTRIPRVIQRAIGMQAHETL